MMSEIDIDHLRQWVGRSMRQDDIISEAPVAGLAATLDRREAPRRGDPLPPLWHWIFFTPRVLQSDLGRDGHPALGQFMPPISLPRRMWAGGRISFHRQLRIGDEAERFTEITGVDVKQGRQSALVFVTLRHRISTSQGLAIEEEQDLVYRGESVPEPPPQIVASGREAVDPPSPEWRDSLLVTSPLLFRYSALTFNAHRIHYDLPYAQSEEGYPQLVVHGPLTATLLAERLLARHASIIRRFEFRGKAPLFACSEARVCGRSTTGSGEFELWAENPDGVVAMTARAVLD